MTSVKAITEEEIETVSPGVCVSLISPDSRKMQKFAPHEINWLYDANRGRDLFLGFVFRIGL